MNHAQRLFLRIMSLALQDKRLPPEEHPVPVWRETIELAQLHSVLPLVLQAVGSVSPLAEMDLYRKTARRHVALQMMKTEAFLTLYRRLKEGGLRPLVVKGLICRSLYPQGDLRLSSDEDILIEPNQVELCHSIMGSCGLTTELTAEQRRTAQEITYIQPGGSLRIEVHTRLFPPESETYGSWNGMFARVRENAVVHEENGEAIYTLSHTEHLLYLLCHAFKHFLHSGFGIRQVCDILLYTQVWGREIDWDAVRSACSSIRADGFVAALYRIGKNHLAMDPAAAGFPAEWLAAAQEETALLEDLLSGGIYGGATMSRRHSSNITLQAAAPAGKDKGGLRRSLFPPAKALEGRYPYLQKHAWLLPAAWLQRFARYGRETAGRDAWEAARIGRQRTQLLRQYGVIDE